MKIAKVEITDKHLFNRIKAAINRIHYVECDRCGAIRVEAHEVARVIHSFIDRIENANDKLNDFCSDFLGQVIESEPDEFESIEKYEKWEADNESRAYHFIDADSYFGKMYGIYEELVLFNNPVCECFGKNKITNEIVIHY